MANDCAEFQTQPTIRRSQSIAGHLRWHGARTEDEVREDREHGATRRTLSPPDADPTQAETDIMGVAHQASTTATRRPVWAESPEPGWRPASPTVFVGLV